MLQLSERTLESAEQAKLDALQAKVNTEKSFQKKVDKAQTLWNSKGDKEGKDKFATIKTLLIEMCVGVEICNYCEGNEANDIEHIYPKSFFPEHTFVWENYLLACKQCNTGYKLDKCYVMDSDGNVYETEREKEPSHKHIAMINPRIEDPNHFLWFNLRNWEFDVRDDLNIFDKNKAEKTLIILGLNTRQYLIEARKTAYNEYYNIMDRLRRIKKARNFDEIKDALNPAQDDILMSLGFDNNTPINEIQDTIEQSVRDSIKKYRHPSVWKAIQTIESRISPKWQAIFACVPTALHW